VGKKDDALTQVRAVFVIIFIQIIFLQTGKTDGEVSKMKNIFTRKDMPMGLSMALAQNVEALNKFASLTPQQQEQMIQHTHVIQSRREMQEFVQRFAAGESNLF